MSGSGASASCANLVELFASIQGEGVHVGEPAVFVRFAECDLRCAWCDSAATWSVPPSCRVELEAGSAAFESVPNPVPLSTVDEALGRWGLAGGQWLSITGGEPLLQPRAVGEVAALGRGRGARVQLETHGLHAAALSQVSAGLDAVAMDWKLASDVRRAGVARRDAGEGFDDLHEVFLRAAIEVPEVSIKVVVTPNTRDDELERACDAIARSAPSATLILQPVTPTGSVLERPSAAKLMAWQRACRSRVPDVRVIPQTHPIYGAL